MPTTNTLTRTTPLTRNTTLHRRLMTVKYVLKRNIIITRFLRAAGALQTSVGWRVEPGMGFIVDITAVS